MALRTKWKPGKEEVVAQNGAVTSMQPQSAEAGLAMLKAGGNAVDAAVAMGFCNVVLEPYMATIGGMGYMLVHVASEGKTYAIDFNGRAPRNANPEMYNVTGPAPAGGIHLFDVEGEANREGPLSVTVPATCAGLCEAHQRFGVLPLEQVLEPAIQLASDGFEANWYLTLYAANSMDAFNRDPYLASMWLPNGRPPRSSPKPGQKVIQRDLGDLLRNIATQGRAAMYEGEVADSIDSFMRDNGGVLTKQDLSDYQPMVSEPLSVTYAGHEVKAVPTPSGGITNLQTFRILESLGFSSMKHNSVEYFHTFIQAARHTFADRFRYLGDWEHSEVPLDGMLSVEYARDIAGLVTASERANVGVDYDEEPWGYYLDRELHDPWRHQSRMAQSPVPVPAMDQNYEDTTQINVVDKDRNAVSFINSLFEAFGSGLVGPESGVLLQNRGFSFNLDKGHANCIAANKRPMHTIIPGMVVKDAKTVMPFGVMGGQYQAFGHMYFLTNLFEHGLGLQEAMDLPRLFPALDGPVEIESGMPADTVAGLEAMGHKTAATAKPIGGAQAIRIDWDEGVLTGASEPRKDGQALGY